LEECNNIKYKTGSSTAPRCHLKNWILHY